MFDVLKTNNITVDQQNKNPNRLSRLPGVWRGENKQYILEYESCGYGSYMEWEERIEHLAKVLNDGFPPIVSEDEVCSNPIPLDAEIIVGLLRRKRKALISGPSKCGKSVFALQLAYSLADGFPFLNWSCYKSSVLYVNFEIEASSFYHRCDQMRQTLNISSNDRKFDTWACKAASSFDEFVPALKERIRYSKYDVIILDPIYRILDGEENFGTDVGHLWDSVSYRGGDTHGT